MNELAIQSLRQAQGEPPSGLLAVSPRREVSIRIAAMSDLPFLDAMQKANGKALGYFPTKQFEGYIAGGHVLVAESVGSRQYAVGSEEGATDDVSSPHSLPTAYCLPPTPLGYVISRDRYLKRDELGIIYQLCVAPGHQRGLIGATLVKEVFTRAAYGCRLFCCWCAQDLSANYFWESLGFVPIAFRGGSGKKKRVHIFWQRRIREGNTTTPWWFPAKTDQGAMREDRLVLPIPPGLRWSDPMPVLKTEECGGVGVSECGGDRHSDTPTRRHAHTSPKVGSKGGPQAPTPRPRAGVQFGPPPTKPVAPVEAKPTRTERSRGESPPAGGSRPRA
jgi:hypothetical protein